MPYGYGKSTESVGNLIVNPDMSVLLDGNDTCIRNFSLIILRDGRKLAELGIISM
jgi:hypothetical protein